VEREAQVKVQEAEIARRETIQPTRLRCNERRTLDPGSPV